MSATDRGPLPRNFFSAVKSISAWRSFGAISGHRCLSLASERHKYRLKDVFGKVAHGGNHKAIAGQVIGFIVVWRELVAIGESHQPRRLSRREQSGTNVVAFYEHEELAA